MITFFNRTEVLVTSDLNHQANARDILRAAGIDCICKTVSRGNSAAVRGRTNGLGESNIYKIFVHEKDRAAAKGLIKLKYNDIFPR